MKTCKICQLLKPLTDFNKKKDTKDGLRTHCRECQKLTRNKEKDSESYKVWASNNKDYLKQKAAKYRVMLGITPLIKGKTIIKKSKPHKLTKEEKRKRANDYYNQRIKTDLVFKLSRQIKSNIIRSFKRINSVKTSTTQNILGCSFKEFKQHLESQFEPWMTWDNYGLYNGTPNFGWDIDHIIPTCSAITNDDVIKLNHYSNLKPLCSYVNRAVKGGKLNY